MWVMHVLLRVASADEPDAQLPVRAPVDELPLRHEPVPAISANALFERRHRRGKAGGIAVATSLVVGTVGPIVAFGLCGPSAGTAEACDEILITGAALELIAGTTYVVGNIVMLEGSISAAYAARDLGADTHTATGWTGAALFTLGAAAIVGGAAGDSGAVAGFGVLGVVTATTLGFVQLGTDGHRQLGFAVVPIPNGLAIGARF